MCKRSRKSPAAFTLIELLVVVAIIAILASLLLPVLSQAKRRAKLVLCRSNIAQQVKGGLIFADDHDGWFPKARGIPMYDTTRESKSGLTVNNVSNWYNQGQHWISEIVCPGDFMTDTVDGMTSNNYRPPASEGYIGSYNLYCPLDYERRSEKQGLTGTIGWSDRTPEKYNSIEYMVRNRWEGYLGYQTRTSTDSTGKALMRPGTDFGWLRVTYSGECWVVHDWAAIKDGYACSSHEGNYKRAASSLKSYPTFYVGHLDGHVDNHRLSNFWGMGWLGAYSIEDSDLDTESSSIE